MNETNRIIENGLFSGGTTPLDTLNSSDKYKFYKLNTTGQIICEFNLNLGLKNGTINIAQITDVHLNFCLDDELEDDEVNFTKKCRIWLANGEAAKPLEKAMDIAALFDQTVITGDILDYLSKGAERLAGQLIFERDKNAVCTIGSHDITKQMQTGLENRLSEEERFSIIQKFWPNDIFYTSKVINSEVIIIGMNTAFNKYYPVQIEKLNADIKKARSEGKYILIFQHDPVSTGNPQDKDLKPVLSISDNIKLRNFYDGRMGYPDFSDDVTKEVYRIITHSSDVIKGLFCGHFHSCFYTEIKAFDKNGNQNPIPQINALSTPCFGGVGVLTRIVIK